MDSRQRYLADQLRRRESEASGLRGSLRELEGKFFQLERAFEMNLQSQSRRELEFNRMKVESEELRKLNDATERERTQLNSRLMNAITERDHWKNSFLQQGEFIKRYKLEHDNAMLLVKQECENVLRKSGESAEERLREMVELCNETKRRVAEFEEQLGTYRGREQVHGNRSLELANLLETFERFTMDAAPVCRLTAEALKNLTDRGNLFDEGMKNLRHLAWSVKDRKDEPRLDLLSEQNSVLREVVRNLKRKTLQETRNENAEVEEGREFDQSIERSRPMKDLSNLNNKKEDDARAGLQEDRDKDERSAISGAHKNDTNPNSIRFDTEKRTTNRCGRMLCIESHLNGAAFEEYVFKLSSDGVIKMRYPVSLSDNAETIEMMFVDTESEYENVSPGRMLVLFKNIHAVVKVKQSGVPCSTQTRRTKTFSSFTQTTFTGTNSFSRLNVGATMLNSEKRAIERSVCNLERTVRGLRSDALHRIESMIGKDSRLLANDEMLDCIRILTR